MQVVEELDEAQQKSCPKGTADVQVVEEPK